MFDGFPTLGVLDVSIGVSLTDPIGAARNVPFSAHQPVKYADGDVQLQNNHTHVYINTCVHISIHFRSVCMFAFMLGCIHIPFIGLSL